MNDASNTVSTPGSGKTAQEQGEQSESLDMDAAQVLLSQASEQTDKPAGQDLPYNVCLETGEQWHLLNGIRLYEWQKDAVEAWLAQDGRGIIKVVTGAGKTVLALAVTQRVQEILEHNLHVAIVVPTIVLAEQWRQVLTSYGNLPTSAIGMLGGGHDQGFSSGVRVLIAVLNSAAAKLPYLVQSAKVGNRLLLIVDECHRAGASERRKIFQTQRRFSLGLSATPERDDGLDDNDAAGGDPLSVSGDEVLAEELGDVVYQLNYAEAISMGVLAAFKIEHYALALTPEERQRYDKISQDITDLRRELEGRNKRGTALLKWCRSASGQSDPRAQQFLYLTTERKSLLYRMSARIGAVEQMVARALADDPKARIIIFHESIEEVNGIFAMLRDKGYPAVVEHSKLPDSERAASIHQFRDGAAQIIVSAKSLVEGFDVPSADLGIIVAASSSVRQRIQTLGRLLRKGGDERKRARLVVFYAERTVDEFIYEKADWDKFVGSDRNEYYKWQLVNSDPERAPGPPRRPRRRDGDIIPSELTEGALYPGMFEGVVYSRDSQGNIYDEEGKSLRPSMELKAILERWLRKGGRFAVTPVRRYLIKMDGNRGGQRKVLWLGAAPVNMFEELSIEQSEALEKATQYGDIYPHAIGKALRFSVLQRDPRLIALKEGRNVRFVTPPERLSDKGKAQQLRQIIDLLHRTYRTGRRINKILVTETGDVVYEYNGRPYYIGKAPEGKEGFLFDS